jgi:hypothetical protein
MADVGKLQPKRKMPDSAFILLSRFMKRLIRIGFILEMDAEAR